MPTTKARVIAHYLPQYHPIPENDQWWEPGFTEWTNVTKARPLFPGHRQPLLPAELGFYDLRLPEVRERQAELAREAGVEAFCYWHYWFNGRRILERPFNEVVASGKPDFPFCVAWANESWQGVWHGCERRTLIEQTYGGEADCDAHFHALLPAFRDPRYLKVDGKLLFVIYRPRQLPNPMEFIGRWNRLARQHALPGFHFVAHTLFSDAPFDWHAAGYDSAIQAHSLKIIRMRAWDVVSTYLKRHNVATALGAAARLLPRRIGQRLFNWPGSIFDYEDACLFTAPAEVCPDGCYPTAVPNWDNSARAGKKGVIFHNATPERFRRHFREVVTSVAHRPLENRLVFLKSWNEWAEGNYVEPDRKWGRAYLHVLRDELKSEATAVPKLTGQATVRSLQTA